MSKSPPIAQRHRLVEWSEQVRGAIPAPHEIRQRATQLRMPTREQADAYLARYGTRVFLLLVALTPVVPHVALAGPISLDDLLPGFATLIGLVVVIEGRRRVRPTLQGWLMLAMVPVSAVSAIAVGSFGSLISGSVRWLQMALVVILAFTLIRDRRTARFYLAALAGVGIFEASFGLWAEIFNFSGGSGYIGIERFRGYESIAGVFPGRITGTLGMAATFVAAFMAACLPVSVGLALATRGRRALWWWAGAGIIALGVFFTFSRISLVAALGFGFAVLILRAPWKVWVPLVIVSVLGIWFSPMRDRLLYDNNDRLQLWTAALTVIRDHPWFGVGAGRYAAYLPFYETTPFGVAGATPHNSVLLAWAEQGLLTGALLAAALLVGFRSLVPAISRGQPLALGAVFGWGAFVFTAMFANLFFIPQVALPLWLMPAAAMGALVGTGTRDEPADDATEPAAASPSPSPEPTES